MTPGTEFLSQIRGEFLRYKTMAERALAQFDDEDMAYRPDPGSNSVNVILKHLAGNMRSRWTDFLTTDGEKPDRNRDGEFDAEDETRDELMARWEAGWALLFDTIDGLTEDDLLKTVHIREKPFTVTRALLYSLCHYAHHVGQIAYIGKHRRGEGWQSLSIPRAGRG